MSCKTSRIVTQFDNPGDEIASDGALTVTLTILSRSSCDPKTELYRENRVEMICDALFSGTPANSAHSKSVQILREMSLLLGCLNEDDR